MFLKVLILEIPKLVSLLGLVLPLVWVKHPGVKLYVWHLELDLFEASHMITRQVSHFIQSDFFY